MFGFSGITLNRAPLVEAKLQNASFSVSTRALVSRSVYSFGTRLVGSRFPGLATTSSSISSLSFLSVLS